MTDQEHKLEIIKKHFIRISIKKDGEKPTEKDIENAFADPDIYEIFSSCMEEWAGVISARIDEQDSEDDDHFQM